VHSVAEAVRRALREGLVYGALFPASCRLRRLSADGVKLARQFSSAMLIACYRRGIA
jgi:predicted nuclease with RNAse H fold